MTRLRALAVACILAGVAVWTSAAVTGHGRVTRSAPSSSPLAVVDRPQLAQTFVAAAATDLAAVAGYDYRQLPAALSGGLAVTTGPYRTAYRAALTGDLAADARRTHRVQSFEQAAIGLGATTADGRQASVLVFGVQVVIDRAGTRRTPVTLTATVLRAGGFLRISRLRSEANPGLPEGSTGLRVAAEAAREAVVDAVPGRSAATVRTAVTALAVASVSVSGDAAAFLVAATARTARASQDTTGDSRYVVDTARRAGRWVATRITTVATA